MNVSLITRASAAGRAARHRHRGLQAVLLVLPLVACQSPSVATQPRPPGATGLQAEQQLLERIHAEIRGARCTQDTQCRTLPLGAKACGGPAQWLAWSVVDSRLERLQPLADELALRQRRRDSADGVVSTCSVVPDPGAACVAGHCVLGDRDRTR